MHDERSHGHRLAPVDIGHMRAPPLDARGRIDGDRVAIEQVVIQRAVRVGCPAIHDVTARLADRRFRVFRSELPSERRARLGEIERVRHVRVWGHDVHRRPDHERRSLVPAQDTRRKGPGQGQLRGVARRDVGERAESAPCVVPRRHRPVGRHPGGRHPDPCARHGPSRRPRCVGAAGDRPDRRADRDTHRRATHGATISRQGVIVDGGNLTSYAVPAAAAAARGRACRPGSCADTRSRRSRPG